MFGIAIDLSVFVSRASAPSVDEVEKIRDAVWRRVSVANRTGSDFGEEGSPRRERSWAVKIVMIGSRWSAFKTSGVVLSAGLKIWIPPHCGISQLFAPVSRMTSGV